MAYARPYVLQIQLFLPFLEPVVLWIPVVSCRRVSNRLLYLLLHRLDSRLTTCPCLLSRLHYLLLWWLLLFLYLLMLLHRHVHLLLLISSLSLWRSRRSGRDRRNLLFLTLLLLVSLLFPLVFVVTALCIVGTALILFALIILLGLCKPLVRIHILRSGFRVFIRRFYFLLCCLIILTLSIRFLLLLRIGRYLLLFILFAICLFVWVLWCIFDFLLDFNNGLNDVLGCYGRLLLLFLLRSSS